MIGISGLYFFLNHFIYAGYFTAVLFLAISSITVRDFIVQTDAVTARHYYFFGSFQRKWVFNRGTEIRISSLDPDFGEDDDFAYPDDLESGLGCFYSLFTFFKPPSIQYRQFMVKEFDHNGKVVKRVQLRLNKEEYSFLRKLESA